MSVEKRGAQGIERWEVALPGGTSMAFCRIPSGSFRMGQRGKSAIEEPVHRVVIESDFWLGETPVTQAQFAAYRVEHENGFEGHPDHPVEQVSWEDAVGYCAWLTEHCGPTFPAGYSVARLPWESEWEYACRAGTETAYHTGDGEGALAAGGWYKGNSGSATHPVGEKASNTWGLYDMHGNVWEWCSDVFDGGAYRKREDGWRARAWTREDAGEDKRSLSDEERRQERLYRVLRGGSWDRSAGGCRSACRLRYWPSERNRLFGFRVCLARSSPAPTEEIEREAEPAPGGVARRDDEAKPYGAGVAGGSHIDLTKEHLPAKPASLFSRLRHSISSALQEYRSRKSK